MKRVACNNTHIERSLSNETHSFFFFIPKNELMWSNARNKPGQEKKSFCACRRDTVWFIFHRRQHAEWRWRVFDGQSADINNHYNVSNVVNLRIICNPNEMACCGRTSQHTHASAVAYIHCMNQHNALTIESHGESLIGFHSSHLRITFASKQ